MMRHAVLFGSLCSWLVAGPPVTIADEQTPSPVLARLYSGLLPVFQRYYPGVASHLGADRMGFEHATRMFLIHTPLKTGEWQEAREVKGPERRGILCSIRLVEGRYDGQAVLPQTLDELYFRTLVLAVGSPGGTGHLYVHLSYPDLVNARFLKEFDDTVQSAWRSGQ